MQTVHLESNMVPAHLRGTYNGKTFKAIVAEQVTVPMDAGLWEGGSRETYELVRLADGVAFEPLPRHLAPWDRDRKEKRLQLEPGIAVRKHSMFCGKDMGLTFYVHPQDATRLLPAPVEMSEHERIVLKATRSYKSSYNGRDRYQMACIDVLSYGQLPVMTRDEWNAAKEALVTRGLLDKRGAITVAGKNAVGSL